MSLFYKKRKSVLAPCKVRTILKNAKRSFILPTTWRIDPTRTDFVEIRPLRRLDKHNFYSAHSCYVLFAQNRVSDETYSWI